MTTQSKPNCDCHCHAGGNFKDCKSHMTLGCEHCTPPSSSLEEKILEFRSKCHLEVSAGGFLRFPLPGDKKTRNWLDERLMGQFISEVIAETYEKGYEDGKETAERMFNN